MALDVPARRGIPTRQAVLFLVAIGLPSVLLVGLSLRILAQERELADKRLADERGRVADDVRQELLARLERLRLDASNGAEGGVFGPDGPVAVVARVDRERLVLPWDSHPAAAAFAAAAAEPAFAEAIRIGERSEFVAHDFDAAAVSYRRALTQARLPSQTAFAQSLIARALSKGRRVADAEAMYRRLLDTPADVVDEQGVPFVLYAARQLLDAKTARDSELTRVLAAIRAALARQSVLSPPAVYMLGDLATALIDQATGPTRRDAQVLKDEAGALSRHIEQAIALQRAFPTLPIRAAAAARSPSQPVWFPFVTGPASWLVGDASVGDEQIVVAARLEMLLASLDAVRQASAAVGGTQLLEIGVTAAGEPLGPQFPGIALTFQPVDTGSLGGAAGAQRSFYLAALALVVSMALLGAYLFWRDVQREVRLADLRSQFVSSVSHELKTPLTAIRMFAETLQIRRSTRPEVRDEYLETIVNESERLTRLLNNVLDFSSIEQGRKVYRFEPQALGSIVRAAAKTMDYPFSQYGFELRVHIEDHLPSVAADSDAIQQAILNLLSNAMKYSGEGRIVDMELKREGVHAVISVIDRGLGIPAAEQTRIFEKFYRLADADRQRIAGTGLGLTLVDHVAKAHGGTVTVRSAPGEGSTFSILLPLRRDTASAPETVLA